LPGDEGWQGRAAETEWKQNVRPILQHFVDRTPGSFIEEKQFALVWHYRLAEAEFGDWLANELVAMLEGMLAETELRAYPGKKIVEIKPMWANKGSFASDILPRYSDAAFVLAMGDDRTDEDMFSRLPESAWSIHVGSGISKARFSIAEPSKVRGLLRVLSSQKVSN
jgi:trehalose 6-phosphate synthase/phosphatase